MSRKRKKKKSLRNTLINIVATLLIILSLLLIFNAPIRNMIMVWHTNQYQVIKVDKKTIDKNKEVKTSFDFQHVQSLSTEAVINAQWQAQKLPVIGGISIPELNMNLPIFKGLENVALYYGAGTMKPDQRMGEGNYSLASHHIFTAENASQMLFSPLVNAKAGMKIYLTDKDKVYTYEITEVKRVTPDRVDEIEDRDGVKEITLVTCVDYNATERIIVKGIFKESKAYSETSEDILKAFNQPYRQRY